MNRREALQRVAWLMGGVISAPALAGLLGDGATNRQGANRKPSFLNEGQAALVARVVDIMIPHTDVPGAIDVGVPAFIDGMLKDTYPQEDRDRYVRGLQVFDAAAQDTFGKPFTELDSDQQMAHVRRIHDEAIAEERSPTGQAPGKLQRSFILMTKELALLGFFTSEAGATEVLQYVAVPGEYRGCVPLPEAGNGKTWAL